MTSLRSRRCVSQQTPPQGGVCLWAVDSGLWRGRRVVRSDGGRQAATGQQFGPRPCALDRSGRDLTGSAAWSRPGRLVPVPVADGNSFGRVTGTQNLASMRVCGLCSRRSRCSRCFRSRGEGAPGEGTLAEMPPNRSEMPPIDAPKRAGCRRKNCPRQGGRMRTMERPEALVLPMKTPHQNGRRRMVADQGGRCSMVSPTGIEPVFAA